MTSHAYTSILQIGGYPIHIVKKDIKKIYLGVYPPHGRIRLSAPLQAHDAVIKNFITDKLPWINQKRKHFEDLKYRRQTPRVYLAGESHYHLGYRYLLQVVLTTGTPHVAITGRQMTLYKRPTTTTQRCKMLFHHFYRTTIHNTVQEILPKWTKIMGIVPTEVRIKRMKTRWGSCNANVGRIWLNLELAKTSLSCIEYVLVHEMVHLLEPSHNARFYHFMDTYLPNWRITKEKLSQAILGHFNWMQS